MGVEPTICDATDHYNRLHAATMTNSLLKQELEHYIVEDVAYKPNCPVDMIEESQPLEVAKRLVHAGKQVTIRDRSAIVELVRRTYGRIFHYKIVEKRTDEPNTTMGNPLSSYES